MALLPSSGVAEGQGWWVTGHVRLFSAGAPTPPQAVAPLTFLPLWLFGDLLPRLPATQRGGEGE